MQEHTQSPKNFFRELEIEFLLHELKDPLSIIETGTRTLLEKREKYGELSTKQEKTLKRTLRNTRKVKEMLNGLLEIGRSESGRFACCRFQPAKVLYGVLVDTLETMDGKTFEAFKSYNEEVEAIQYLQDSGFFLHVAAQDVELEVVQDETKFRQIVGNLIKNALYHRKKRIDIRIKHEDESFSIEVSDDGPGIEPENHTIIFQRYAQLADHSSSPRKGHGLGLAGAMTLAHYLGGNIELHSQKGEGATFRLILPVELNKEDDAN